jgi:integrase
VRRDTCIDITDSKTAAGIHVVPVHPALANVVTRLATDSRDGFLIPTTCRNQYGIRSDALSKAFGRLKTSLGFGSKHVFHSIRASAITHLVRADVADRLIKELVGHETGTVTFDVYSLGSSAKQKLDAISKLPILA